jgi:hypothetical protein
MKDDKKRNVKRIKDRVGNKAPTFPEMPTEDIAAKHLGKSKKELKENTSDYPNNTDVNEQGKEDFEGLLFMMTKPDLD